MCVPLCRKSKSNYDRRSSLFFFALSLAHPGLLPLIIFIIGQSSEIIALSYATETTVVAFGNFSLVWNALASRFVFKEKFVLRPPPTWRRIAEWDLLSLLLLICGAVTVGMNAPPMKDEDELSAAKLSAMFVEFPFAIALGLLLSALGAASAYLRRNWGDDTNNVNAVLLGLVCAVISVFSVTLSKVTTELLGKTFGGDNQYGSPQAVFMTIAWIAALLSSLFLINLGLRRFEQALFVPMYEVMSTTLTIVCGSLYYKTCKNFQRPVNAVLFAFGFAVLVLGLYFSSQREHRTQKELKKAFLHTQVGAVWVGEDATDFLLSREREEEEEEDDAVMAAL